MSHSFLPPLDDTCIENVLAMQANALNQGRDTTEWLITQFAAESSPQTAEQLIALLYLAQQLKRVLVPLPAPRRLAHRPVAPPPAPVAKPQHLWWMWAALVSLVAGLAGLVLWRHGRLANAK